ncbi:FMRFamide-activated amiloride-sensitive sodium channel-like [Tubulanus polymorphus]|uniref:FMRFamide-activated amiloride-sensitive sodium channel-like n=1 Tax=Tubulanus polymorphus TaxID=672921 RepID=UPI003DA6C19C
MQPETEEQTVSNILKGFLVKSTIRGVSRTVRSATVFWRIVWTVAVLSLSALAIYQIQEVTKVYMNFEAETREYTDYGAGFEFPSITVCNQQPLSSAGRRLTKIANDTQNLRKFYKNVRHLYESASSLEERNLWDQLLNMAGFYQNIKQSSIHDIGHKADRFISRCEIEIITNKGVRMVNCTNVNHFVDVNHFNCYTIEPEIEDEELQSKTRSVELVLYLDMFDFEITDLLAEDTSAVVGAKLVLHENDAYPNFVDDAILVSHGVNLWVKAETNIWSHLPEPYGKCDNDLSKTILKTEPNNEYIYRRNLCILQCKQNYIMAKCGCRSAIYPTPIHESATLKNNSLPFCGHLYENITRTHRNLNCMVNKNIFIERNLFDKCNCKLPCNHVTYRAQTMQTFWPDLPYHLPFYHRFIKHKSFADKFAIYENITKIATVDLKKAMAMLQENNLIRYNFIKVTVIQEQGYVKRNVESIKVTLPSLLSQIGGTLSLYVGVTAIVVVEVFELLSNLCKHAYCKFKRSRERRINDGSRCDTMFGMKSVTHH